MSNIDNTTIGIHHDHITINGQRIATSPGIGIKTNGRYAEVTLTIYTRKVHIHGQPDIPKDFDYSDINKQMAGENQ